jgi:hypothetical protein
MSEPSNQQLCLLLYLFFILFSLCYFLPRQSVQFVLDLFLDNGIIVPGTAWDPTHEVSGTEHPLLGAISRGSFDDKSADRQ